MNIRWQEKYVNPLELPIFFQIIWWALVEKVSDPLDSVTGQISFGNNNLKSNLVAAADQTCIQEELLTILPIELPQFKHS